MRGHTTCLKCKQNYSEEHHECLEEMTIDELFDSCLSDVRSAMAELDLPGLEVEAAKCEFCQSTEVELWGESGVFWPHCHDCGRDGADLPDAAQVSDIDLDVDENGELSIIDGKEQLSKAILNHLRKNNPTP